MAMPERIQRRRTKGWKMTEGAIYVGRPTKWGNPFRINSMALPCDERWPYLLRAFDGDAAGFRSITPLHPQCVVDAYAWWIIEQPPLMLSLDELRGRDLVCWCPLDQPCHADVLLELAHA
ncbi:MAG TPA: DUF4326 domain-containing protein [Candidatus Saccharimonadales bacterium]|nr:DUF4326 domain-containing protein [Candidatus Saccharimonadales bacterium]